jgi:epoxyqueuosine reductase QueG
MAGLGVIGKSALLVNKDFGSLMHLGAVLVDAELEPDPLATYTICRVSCRECIDACPAQALDGMGGVDMERCRAYAQRITPGGQTLWSCTQCRRVCPNNHLE